MTKIKRILAACRLDGKQAAVLGCAAALAEKQAAELHLLHVLPEQGSERQSEGDVRHARDQLEALLPPEQVINLCMYWEVRHGSTSKAIVDYVKEAGIDMIVMGSHHRSGLKRMASSSTSSQVLKAATCPVVVVPTDRKAQAATLSQMAGLLQESFGDRLPGDRQAAWVQMRETLERHLDLSSEQAEKGLQQLQTAKGLDWEATESGPAWHIQPTAIVDPHAKPIFTAATSPQAATPATDLLRRAFALRATDIHIDPAHDDSHTVRMRIDGQLEHYCDLDNDLAEHLLQQFKVMAGLDITEPFKPHEGHLRLDDSALNGQIRITTSPVQGGDSACLRLQSQDSMLRPLSELGLSSSMHEAVTSILHRGEGLILVTGPTGAGKTTMVYSMLRELEPHEHHRNIVTIEDPVEFKVPFLRQLSVNEAQGLTLEMGLRTMLRMDPDVIFVGEIRDSQTATLAMRAASSGKYVFSTLHTRDVASTVTALRDLGVPSTSLSGNLTGIISQRLVRRLCPRCREQREIVDAERQLLAEHQLEAPALVYRAVGCEYCRHVGYFGRLGIYEVVVADHAIGELINRNASEEETREAIRATGVPSLMADGLSKALAGWTSIEEVQRMRWM